MSFKPILLAVAALGMSACTETEPIAVTVPQDPGKLDSWLQQREAAVQAITPGTEKRIVWHGGAGQRTPISVVYLHGYSATRQETAPLAVNLAERLNANLFETRLAGHGRPGEALANVGKEDWLRDTQEAYAIGRAMGEQVLVLSVSTGSTLSTWLAAQPATELAAQIMISPNFDLPDPGAYRIDWPLGLGVLLAEWLVGKERSWEPINDDHGRYWTTRYPTRAVRPLIRLLKQVKAIDKTTIDTPTLVVYSPADKVISVPAVLETFAQFASAHNRLVEFSAADDPYQHVLAGWILSPTATDPMRDIVLEYLDEIGLAGEPK